MVSRQLAIPAVKYLTLFALVVSLLWNCTRVEASPEHNVITSEESTSNALCAKASDLIDDGQLGEAFRILQQSLLTWPESQRARWQFARLFLKRREVNRAKPFLKEINPSTELVNHDWIFWISLFQHDSAECLKRIPVINSSAAILANRAHVKGLDARVQGELRKRSAVGQDNKLLQIFPIAKLVDKYEEWTSKQIADDEYLLACDQILGPDFVSLAGELDPLAMALFSEAIKQLWDRGAKAGDALQNRLISPAMILELKYGKAASKLRSNESL